MFNGKLKKVTLAFDDSLIGVIYDKFGEDAEITRISKTRCKASVTVQVSPTFWGWLFQFVGQMEIRAPKQLAEEYNNRCVKVLSGATGRSEEEQ